MKLTGDRCQCAGGCGEYFNSTTAFDRHRRGTYQPMARRCLTVPEMLAAGMAKNVAGFWVKHLHTDSSVRRARTGGVLDPTPYPDSPSPNIPAASAFPAVRTEEVA